jgi:hypothetical protein
MSEQKLDHGKVTLHNTKTGETMERWVVDAREIVATSNGEWAFDEEGSTTPAHPQRSGWVGDGLSPHSGGPDVPPVAGSDVH